MIERLVAQRPPDVAAGLFERACALDSTGSSDLAVPRYWQALACGLACERRRGAVIQLASSLRSIGWAEESVQLLSTELDVTSNDLDDAVGGCLSLALADTEREREALSLAVISPPGPQPIRYQRSLANYSDLLQSR